MSTADVGVDVAGLRQRVRSAQHARSLPLLALGSLLVNYGSGQFAPSPVAWRFGAPLAFVLVWVLLKINESRAGVGTGRADYLVAAGCVFAATNVVTLRPFDDHLRDVFRVQGIWVLIVGVALLGVARVARDRVLSLAGTVVAGAGVLGIFLGPAWEGDASVALGVFPTQPWTDVIFAAVGVAMIVVGIVVYRGERAPT